MQDHLAGGFAIQHSSGSHQQFPGKLLSEMGNEFGGVVVCAGNLHDIDAAGQTTPGDFFRPSAGSGTHNGHGTAVCDPACDVGFFQKRPHAAVFDSPPVRAARCR